MIDGEFSGVFRFHYNEKYVYVNTKCNNTYTTNTHAHTHIYISSIVQLSRHLNDERIF